MLDLLIHNATLPDGRTGMSVAVQDRVIAQVAPGLLVPAHSLIDAQGQLHFSSGLLAGGQQTRQ